MDYEIKDNFLEDEPFKFIEQQLMGSQFPWYYQPNVVSEDGDTDYYFSHQMYVSDKWQSDSEMIARPLLDAISPSSLIRVKANCYPRTEKILTHKAHIDQTWEHNACLLYINDNNGFTIMHDGTKIESKRNRLVLFNGSKDHCSTTCTDAHVRVNLGVNFF